MCRNALFGRDPERQRRVSEGMAVLCLVFAALGSLADARASAQPMTQPPPSGLYERWSPTLLGPVPLGTDPAAGAGCVGGQGPGDPGAPRDGAAEAAGGAMNRRVFLSASSS